MSSVLVDACTKVWVNELESRNECYMYRYRYKYAEFPTILEAVWCLFLSLLFCISDLKKKHYPRVNFDRPWVPKCDWVLMNRKTSKSIWGFFNATSTIKGLILNTRYFFEKYCNKINLPSGHEILMILIQFEVLRKCFIYNVFNVYEWVKKYMVFGIIYHIFS